MKSPQDSLVIGTFEDPGFRPEIWDGLLDAGPSRSVFQTWAWQCSWWQVFGRGHLILMRMDLDGGPALIAPLFSDGGWFSSSAQAVPTT